MGYISFLPKTYTYLITMKEYITVKLKSTIQTTNASRPIKKLNHCHV